jgi:hypothetical protein
VGCRRIGQNREYKCRWLRNSSILQTLFFIPLPWSIKPGHYPGEKQHHPHAFVQKNADIDAIEDKKQINDHHTAKNREAEAEGFSAHNGVSIDRDK